jgi:hypothetical protein
MTNDAGTNFATIDKEIRNIETVQLKQVRNIMAFVNEFASDEDIIKYNLN